MIGILVLVVLREPRRGLVDNMPRQASPPPNFRAFLREVGRKQGLLFVIIGGSLAGFGMTSISQFLAVYVARMYELPVQQAGTLYGAISGISLGIGLLAGSFGTDWLASRGDARWPAWGAAAGLFVAPMLYWTAFSVTSMWIGSALLTISGAALLLFYGPTQGMIQNMLEPRMRATGAALFSILYTIFGYGMGPTFVGWLSDRYAAASYTGANYFEQCHGGAKAALARAAADPCAEAATYGIRSALMSAVLVFFVAALCYLMAARTMRNDFYVAEPDA
jgi:hypothetical protein